MYKNAKNCNVSWNIFLVVVAVVVVVVVVVYIYIFLLPTSWKFVYFAVSAVATKSRNEFCHKYVTNGFKHKLAK